MPWSWVRRWGWTRTSCRRSRAASILHDIGKLAVPEHIISKPGKLTSEEFEKMKIHPVVGAEILARVQFPYDVVPIVRAHHERWNGTGYPDGLKGEEIPIGARILSAVDCLDALASDRQYRRALPLDEAMAVIVAEAGKSYEPRIVKMLQEHYEEWETPDAFQRAAEQGAVQGRDHRQRRRARGRIPGTRLGRPAAAGVSVFDCGGTAGSADALRIDAGSGKFPQPA